MASLIASTHAVFVIHAEVVSFAPCVIMSSPYPASALPCPGGSASDAQSEVTYLRVAVTAWRPVESALRCLHQRNNTRAGKVHIMPIRSSMSHPFTKPP